MKPKRPSAQEVWDFLRNIPVPFPPANGIAVLTFDQYFKAMQVVFEKWGVKVFYELEDLFQAEGQDFGSARIFAFSTFEQFQKEWEM